MKKRMLALALCACALMATPAPAFAAQVPEEIVSPFMLLINQADANLTVSGGTAKVTASVIGIVGTVTKTEVKAELQVKDGSSWRHVEDWSASKNSYRASLSESHAVVAGNTYRVKVIVTAWNGNQSETQTIYSSQRKA